MPITYFDLRIKQQSESTHPALEVNESHPCYRMVREGIDGKSVFNWTRSQAYAMYMWYCEGWKSSDLVDEFGDSVDSYNFKDIIKKSHFVVTPATKVSKAVISEETIEELYAAVEMEKKILESIGEEEDDEDT